MSLTYPLSKNLFKGAALLSIGQVSVYGLSFVRNIILARVLTKTDFGLAAALSLTMTLLEFVNRMSFGKQIIQAIEGDKIEYQSVAHATQMAVGVISATLVTLGAYPVAIAFGVPNLTWAFAALAFVPLARGAMHLDPMRIQRKFIFSKSVINEVVPQVFATLAAWPLAVWMGDFRAVLWIMLGKEVLTVAISHLIAERPYRWAWNSNYAKHMLTFGWPLILNGFVMFASQQGDQMVIGSTFSLSDLGTYSIAFTLSSLPFLIFGQVGTSLMLPSLSRVQNDPVRFEEYYFRCLEISAAIGMFLLGPIVVSGEAFVLFIYGNKYSGAGNLMAVFGVIVALRIFRWAPAVASMSRADTVNQLIGNVARSFSLPLAILIVALGTRSMAIVAACGIFGEMLSIPVTVYRLRLKYNINIKAHIKTIIFLLSWITVGLLLNQCLGEVYSMWIGGLALLGFWTVGAGLSFIFFPKLRYIFIDAFLYRISCKNKIPG